MIVKTINATEARKNIYHLMSSIIASHQPIQITGKTGSVIMLSESDWSAIQETLYLDAIPGMTDSIIKGMQATEKECSTELKW